MSLFRAGVLAFALALPLASVAYAGDGEGCSAGHGLCTAPEAWFGPNGEPQTAQTVKTMQKAARTLQQLREADTQARGATR